MTDGSAADHPVEPAVEIPHDDPELVGVIETARLKLGELVGSTIDAITISSSDPAEAPLLGANVSKLSPLASTMLEHRTVTELAAATDGGRFEIERQDPGFPDAGVFANGLPTGHGLEIKAYNVLATEITARFRASQLALADKNIQVVLICWVMDRVIFGRPLILDVQFIEAKGLAATRDAHYNRPPQYVVSPPDDNDGRIASMLLRNVEGHVLQNASTSQADLERVRVIQESLIQRADLTQPHHEVTSELTRHLRSNLNYRLDTNFAKIDRVNHPDVEAAKSRNLARSHLGRTFAEWQSILSDMKKGSSAAFSAISNLY